MKKLILALLPAVLLMAGCEDPCSTGFEVKARASQNELLVGGIFTTPASFGDECRVFRSGTIAQLDKDSRFAANVARRYFYWEESVCDHGHYERRCQWRRYGYNCYDFYVCDYVRIVPHTRDGYEQAMSLSSELSAAALELALACDEHDRSQDAQALLDLVKAKDNLRGAQPDAEQVLQKAGCYSRRGD